MAIDLFTGGALIGLVTALWSKIKLWATKINRIIFVKVDISSHIIVSGIRVYLMRYYKKSSLNVIYIQSRFDYIKPLKKHRTVGFETFLGSEASIWRRGWKFLLVTMDYDKANLVFIRGTLDYKKFIEDSIIIYHELCDDSFVEKNRFFIIQRNGRLGENPSYAYGNPGKNASSDNSPQISEKTEGLESKYEGAPLIWGTEDLGLPRVAEAVDRLSLSDNIIATIDEVVRWKKSEKWFKDRSIPWKMGLTLIGDPGTGKAQPLDSLIKIPGGWKKMGELKLMDLVCTPDGITSPITGIFPQGLKEIYKISFDDNTSVEACGDHLWEVRLERKNKEAVILSTEEIINFRRRKIFNKVWVPLTAPTFSEKISLPLDPYFLGALLGDGNIKSSIMFSTSDSFILDKLSSKLKYDYKFIHVSNYDYRISKGTGSGNNSVNYYASILKELGLFGKTFIDKFIPPQYLNSSAEDRLEILKGLMDTDGTVGSSGDVQFSSSSLSLATGVIDLVRSLGGKAFIIKEYYPAYTYKGIKHISKHLHYIVSIVIQRPEILFSLPRKRDRCINVRRDNRVIIKKRITNIEMIGKKEAQCILVDHPSHLYITDGYTVTHNTAFVRAIAQKLNIPIVVFNLSTMSNKDFLDAWEGASSYLPAIFLFEDMDAVFDKRNNLCSTATAKGVSFDILLNTIDGVNNTDGVLLIITTNHAEKLDDALGNVYNGISTRPGRIDRVLKFERLDLKGKEKIANRIFDNIDRKLWNHLLNETENDTGAQFQFRCSSLALKLWKELYVNEV